MDVTSIQLALRGLESGRVREARRCEVCGGLTADRKPMCEGHVDRMPQVRRILDELAAAEAHDALVELRGPEAVDLGSLAVRGVLAALWLDGPQPVARLARACGLSFDLVRAAVARLVEAGVVEFRRRATRKRPECGTVSLVADLAALDDPRGLVPAVQRMARRPRRVARGQQQELAASGVA